MQANAQPADLLNRLKAKAKTLYSDTVSPIGRQDWWIGFGGIVLAQLIVSSPLKVFAFGSTGSSFAIGICQLVAAAVVFLPFRNLTLKRLHARNRPSVLFWVFFLPGLVMSLGYLLGLNGAVDDSARLSITPFGQILNLATLAAFIWMVIELGIRNKPVTH